jgi:hypothetical protein
MQINSVLNQLSWDTWHVGRLPSEDIVVIPEKIGEHEFLFLRKVSTDGRRLGESPVPRSIFITSTSLGGTRIAGFLADSSKSSGLAWLTRVAISSLSKST